MSDVIHLLLCSYDLDASICIVMSGATGNWVLMFHESDVVFWGDFGRVAPVCHRESFS